MAPRRQILFAVFILLTLGPLRARARVCDRLLGSSEHAAVEEMLRSELTRESARVFGYAFTSPPPRVRLNFKWGRDVRFVTSRIRDQITVVVPRSLGTQAALKRATGRRAALKAVFIHQLGHVIYAAAGGGDLAFAELFADVLTVTDLADANAIPRAFDANRPRGELEPIEYLNAGSRLNLVRSELAHRAAWVELRDDLPARGRYLRHVLNALVTTSTRYFRAPTPETAGRMNLAVLKALGYH